MLEIKQGRRQEAMACVIRGSSATLGSLQHSYVPVFFQFCFLYLFQTENNLVSEIYFECITLRYQTCLLGSEQVVIKMIIFIYSRLCFNNNWSSVSQITKDFIATSEASMLTLLLRANYLYVWYDNYLSIYTIYPCTPIYKHLYQLHFLKTNNRALVQSHLR